jgi:hypothetical protein
MNAGPGGPSDADEPAPDAVTQDLERLRAALRVELPRKQRGNLLVATWNLRAFGGLTSKWQAGSGDSPARDWHAIACIAAVVSCFDVVAVQETRRNTQALRALLWFLGRRWRVIASDVTEGGPGNGERLAFLYDESRVRPSGLVGEIVIPAEVGTSVQQFARSPYLAGFTSGAADFILVTVHVLWGRRASDRLPEIRAFAEWMRRWAVRPEDWNDNLLVLGDFNLDRLGDPLYEAFVSTGLWPPAELNRVPRTIFHSPKSPHFYDQIAWFSDTRDRSLLRSLAYTRRGGSFDFLPHVMAGRSPAQVSWRISDHYPLWVEFRT